MPFDKTKNQRKGFGFITFEREETMKELIKKGKDKIGEHEIDLKKATPKSDPYFGAGYSDFYGYDSAVQTEEKKVRNLEKACNIGCCLCTSCKLVISI